MKHLTLILIILLSSLALAADADSSREGLIREKFAPGGYIRLRLGPGGYTITKGSEDAIQVSYRTNSPEQARKVRVDIHANAASADVLVSNTPHNNFQATIEIPRLSNLRVRLFAGEVVIDGIEGDKDVEVSAGRIEIRIAHPDEYGRRDASVRAGSIEAAAFNVSKGGLFRSFEQKGSGKYRLHAHVATGEIDLPGPI